ncbi:MAG: cobalamin-dependent protein, partial [Bdellovibrio sp.]
MAEKFIHPVEAPKYQARHPIRMVTAASLFDGHDAAINMIRRLLQDSGVEVIHLGHNRSVQEVVEACLQECVQGVCVSSYQGGHMEYFKYMRDLLAEKGASHVQIFGGGGGVIIHEEKAELEKYGIAHIFHPDDGRRLGLQGMINLILEKCDFDPSLQFVPTSQPFAQGDPSSSSALSQATLGEKGWKLTEASLELGNLFSCVEKGLVPGVPERYRARRAPLVLGITGTGGAGKSSLIDEILQRFLNVRPELKIGVFCVDPSKRKTGGSLLGDRIRMN